MASRRTLIVGDVHGCVDELKSLLRVAGFARGDRLILAGDLVAKGPDSQGVVQLAREAGAESVKGNHDAHVLGARVGKELKAHHAKVAKSLTENDWRFLEAMPLWIAAEELELLVVHAGLKPGVALEDQNPTDLFTMRSLDSAGNPTPRIEGGVPWVSKWVGPPYVVFGHDAVRGMQMTRWAIGLDTGCVYGRELTGVWLPERRMVSVAAKKAWASVERGD